MQFNTGSSSGRYLARFTDSEADVRAAQSLRHFAFHGRPGSDSDSFDPLCRHVLVQEVGTGELVCCFRILALTSGADIPRSYSAQFYDLSALAGFTGHMVEMGRFCTHPDHHDPDILRTAWGALTRYVDENAIELLFGCTSFPGIDARPFHDSFAMLRDRHLAPACWSPQIKAAKVHDFAHQLSAKPDIKTALQQMPPLLRSYLMLGGWVSDHAVIDTQMNTMHVFTGVEIAAIPEARKKLLRALAASQAESA